MAYREGEVRVGDIPAGRISETEEGYRFGYTAEYLAHPDALPASVTLPLRMESYDSKVLFPFFDGLIPEGWLLDIAGKTWKLDPRDRMGLLLACCADCIGNVSVIPVGPG
jgi:serine/threonine-protein kinase HipA